MRRSVVGMSAAACLACGSAAACVWDTDTLRDELQMQAGVFDLITGQFPHHGKGYYEARVRRLEPRIRAGSSDIEVLNDLGVAYLKLGRFDEARHTFDVIETIAPGRYETLSNLGVLEKKRGDFASAAAFTERALALRPEGHLGLGDYYLHMLRWQDASRAGSPAANFLGAPYGTGYEGLDYCGEVDHERLHALIRSDRTFSDALFVLGDCMLEFSRHELNLALWAYVRALDLGHPRPDIIRARMDRSSITGRKRRATSLEAT